MIPITDRDYRIRFMVRATEHALRPSLITITAFLLAYRSTRNARPRICALSTGLIPSKATAFTRIACPDRKLSYSSSLRYDQVRLTHRHIIRARPSRWVCGAHPPPPRSPPSLAYKHSPPAPTGENFVRRQALALVWFKETTRLHVPYFNPYMASIRASEDAHRRTLSGRSRLGPEELIRTFWLADSCDRSPA